jgi:6-phosphofructokinase 1
VRVSNLGYIQRGGTPTARTRILASQFGAYAVKLLAEGKSNLLVGLIEGRLSTTDIPTAIKKEKDFNKTAYEVLKRLSI